MLVASWTFLANYYHHEHNMLLVKCNSIPYKLNLRSYAHNKFYKNVCSFEAFTVIIWKVQNVFGLESMSEISCAPGVMIHGVEVLFLSPVGYVSLQSLSPGVESCSSCSFAQLLRMLQVCMCPPFVCHSSYSYPDY